LRRAAARPLFVVSLIAVVVTVVWPFAATDLIAVKGLATAAGFPLVIALIGVFQLWLSIRAGRHWIG
jgi:hypothetical protein